MDSLSQARPARILGSSRSCAATFRGAATSGHKLVWDKRRLQGLQAGPFWGGAARVARMNEYAVGGELTVVIGGLRPPLQGWRRLLLVRHGQTKSNKESVLQGGGTDTALNELGQVQARQLATALAATRARIDRIATSQLSRAIATGDAIAQQFPTATRTTNASLGEMLYGEVCV